MSRCVLIIVFLFYFFTSNGVSSHFTANNDTVYRAFVVFLPSNIKESTLNPFCHSGCIGEYSSLDTLKSIKGLQMEGLEITRIKVDALKDSYYSLDPEKSDFDGFCKSFNETFSIENFEKFKEDDRTYALEAIRTMAHDALVTSQSAFGEYPGNKDEIVSLIENRYGQINKVFMKFLEKCL